MNLYHGAFCRNPLHPGPCKGWKRGGQAAPEASSAPARGKQKPALRPTASAKVKPPPYRKVAPVPRGTIFAESWMHRDEPEERAPGFWQGRFSDQRAIKQVFKNMAAGKKGDALLDGARADGNNWDLTYLAAQKYNPKAADDDEPEYVYNREDLKNELVNAAGWLHRELANAPVSTQPLYRGMRMRRSEVPEVGKTFEADAVSWAERRYWAEHYAGLKEDESMGRIGDTEVVFRLNGPKRSVDLGENFLNEHITQGKYRVVKVTGTGRRRFVTVEEVGEDG